MKKRIVSFGIAFALCILVCSCSGSGKDEGGTNIENETETELISGHFADTACPDISQIRSICELATLECYYHNVAKSKKEKGEGISHIGEKERIFWIEYSGIAKFGINAAKVHMEVSGTQVSITIPRAELLGMAGYSFTEDSYISSEDGLNKNPITAQNQTEAIAAAEADIRELFENDDTMLMRAQDNAKKLIENYVEQLGEISGADYQITWKYEENSKEESEMENESEI